MHNGKETTLIVGHMLSQKLAKDTGRTHSMSNWRRYFPMLPGIRRSSYSVISMLTYLNPQDRCCGEHMVGPYGCWKRPTNDNGLHLLGLCSHFGLVLTNTLSKMKNKDIFTYHDKGLHGGWRLTDHIVIRRKYLSTFYCTKVLRGARKLYPSANHHLVRWELLGIMAESHSVKIRQEGYRWDQTTAGNCWIKAPAG